jgi:hypothetical protein
MSVEVSRKHGPFDTCRDERECPTSSPRTPTLRLVPNEPVPPAIEAELDMAGAGRLLAAVAAVQVWEGEGGYTPNPTKTLGGRHG